MHSFPRHTCETTWLSRVPWKYLHKKGALTNNGVDCNEEERADDAQIKFAAGGSTESQLNLSLAGSAVFCLIDLWYRTLM